MDWRFAITRNRDALLAVVAAIAALIGDRDGGPIARRLRSAALALLRPAEAAARRLIVIAARGLAVSPGPRPAPVLVSAGPRKAGHDRTPAFPLLDRPKRFALRLPRAQPRGIPRIRSFFGPLAQPIATQPPGRTRPDPDALVDAGRLHLRLRSLEAALADLPRQIRRLARLRARRASGAKPCKPMRLGRPPGWRLKPDREIDLVLRECHALALDTERADTS